MTQVIQQPQTAQRVAIALSREELYVILRLLKASSLPGFDLSWVQKNEDGTLTDEMQRVLEVATNALVARGYIAIKPSETATQQPAPLLNVTMPPQVISLVGSCAFAERTVLLSLSVSPGPNLTYLHQYQQLGVVHTMPQQDVHLFELVDGRDGLIAVVHEALALEQQQVLSIPAGDVAAVDMLAARDAARDGRTEEALTFLKRGGLALPTAQALASALQDASSIGVVVIAGQGDQKARNTITYVTTPSTCFTFTEHQVATTHIFHVESVSAETIRARLQQAL